ncbi:nuclear transport factor 2 family protein [Streptomyces sp. NPDC088387]|uniref:nuclear transport factor 2 family protein n=1 Tax=Streptomyces sp. NPDC088387 TaxID=3365859 RepID=UPI003826E759
MTFSSDGQEVRAILPRFVNPAYVQITDGKRIDYDDLVVHLEHLRSVVANGEFAVHHAVREGRSFAERHTVNITMKAGGASSFEVMMFGVLDEEDRLLAVHESTRQISGDSADADLGSAL